MSTIDVAGNRVNDRIAKVAAETSRSDVEDLRRKEQYTTYSSTSFLIVKHEELKGHNDNEQKEARHTQD